MKHKKISIILTIFMILSMSVAVNAATATTYDAQLAKSLKNSIATMEKYESAAHKMAEAGRALGYKENHSVITLAHQEWLAANTKKKQYQNQLNAMPKPKDNKYPVANEIWDYLKRQGFNDYVCAGILGNIMTECGGQTLNIKYNASSSGYYGICQWSKKYYPKVNGANLNTQLNFLRDTIKTQMNTYGKKYKAGFNYNSFINLKDAKAAALVFAKCYERCGSGSYSVRQKNAITAYNYFH